LFVCCSGWNAAEVAILEAVAVAFEGDYLSVVNEPVDHRCGDHIVAEDLSPPTKWFVARHDQRGPLVPGRDQLEEQVRRFGFERDVADLVELCGYPHRLTYADPATMPSVVVGRGG
jgi:diadenosine tetraphosphatase ApaH/serine/threonine PP2A family protein phosphatase